MLKQIQIILVETTHSGNIGSAARAMKTMGLKHLRLVNPQCECDEQAVALSAGAEDVVKNAEIFPTFKDAVADCELVIGTSARLRHLQNTLITPKEAAKKVFQSHQGNPQGKIALVFGRERSGLLNEELLQCAYHLFVPTNPEYSSLNLAMAVQIVCYELRQATLQTENIPTQLQEEKIYPKASEWQYFFQATEKLYQELGFIKNAGVMQKLQHLYQRANLDKSELSLLCGMLRAVKERLHQSEK